MTLFWILLILITVVALGTVVLPILRHHRRLNEAYNLHHMQGSAEQLQFIDAQRTDGFLSADQCFRAKAELANQVLRQKPAKSGFSLNWGVFLFAILLLQVLSLAIYQHLGNSKGYEQWLKDTTMAGESITAQGATDDPTPVMVRMQQHLKEHPDSAQGWYLLGRLYASGGESQQAKAAFARAYELAPEDRNVKLQYAGALFLTQNNSLRPKAAKLVQQVLASDPNNIAALNLLAMDAYHRKDTQEALRYWQQAQTLAPKGGEIAQSIDKAIANVENQPSHETSATPVKFSLPIQVNVSAALKNKIKTSDTLFVYLKLATGAPRPIAVLRLPMSQFPLTVQLTEANVMSALGPVPPLNAVQVIARISQSGEALTQAGNLQGESTRFDATHPPAQIAVNISKIIG
jgi:cytochrome c-type biogenesis protein CcmH